MATTTITAAQVYSEWDPATPIATIDLVESGYRVSFVIGSWVTVPEGKDTAPVFPTFAEAQAIAEKFGQVMAEIKTAAAAKITELLGALPDRKA